MSVQILLSAAAREEAVLELPIKTLEPYIITVPITTPDGERVGDEYRELCFGMVPVIGSQWARITVRASEIARIADANAYMYERNEGEWDKLSVIELKSQTIYLVRAKYEELRAVIYGVSHAPILNVTTN